MIYNPKHLADIFKLHVQTRVDIFKRKIADQYYIPPKLSSLPLTVAAFKLHFQHAHFQTALWKAAGTSSLPNLDPLDQNFYQFLTHQGSYLHRMRCSTSSVVKTGHFALVLNSPLYLLSLFQMYAWDKLAAKTQRKQTVMTVAMKNLHSQARKN